LPFEKKIARIDVSLVVPCGVRGNFVFQPRLPWMLFFILVVQNLNPSHKKGVFNPCVEFGFGQAGG
jgi:hypothetical protein